MAAWNFVKFSTAQYTIHRCFQRKLCPVLSYWICFYNLIFLFTNKCNKISLYLSQLSIKKTSAPTYWHTEKTLNPTHLLFIWSAAKKTINILIKKNWQWLTQYTLYWQRLYMWNTRSTRFVSIFNSINKFFTFTF